IYLLAPVVKGRKGHYRELFEKIAKQGFIKVRIDGKITEITYGLKLDRYKIHDIEILIDTVTINEENIARLKRSLSDTLKYGKGSIVIQSKNGKEDARHFS